MRRNSLCPLGIVISRITRCDIPHSRMTSHHVLSQRALPGSGSAQNERLRRHGKSMWFSNHKSSESTTFLRGRELRRYTKRSGSDFRPLQLRDSAGIMKFSFTGLHRSNALTNQRALCHANPTDVQPLQNQTWTTSLPLSSESSEWG